jgi:hypothetical protein
MALQHGQAFLESVPMLSIGVSVRKENLGRHPSSHARYFA